MTKLNTMMLTTMYKTDGQHVEDFFSIQNSFALLCNTLF